LCTTVHYQDAVIGEYFVDLLVEDTLPVELKTVKARDDAHRMHAPIISKRPPANSACRLISAAAPGAQTRGPRPMNHAVNHVERSACFACIICLICVKTFIAPAPPQGAQREPIPFRIATSPCHGQHHRAAEPGPAGPSGIIPRQQAAHPASAIGVAAYRRRRVGRRTALSGGGLN